jgi:hypothetical protein
MALGMYGRLIFRTYRSVHTGELEHMDPTDSIWIFLPCLACQLVRALVASTKALPYSLCDTTAHRESTDRFNAAAA